MREKLVDDPLVVSTMSNRGVGKTGEPVAALLFLRAQITSARFTADFSCCCRDRNPTHSPPRHQLIRGSVTAVSRLRNGGSRTMPEF